MSADSTPTPVKGCAHPGIWHKAFISSSDGAFAPIFALRRWMKVSACLGTTASVVRVCSKQRSSGGRSPEQLMFCH